MADYFVAVVVVAVDAVVAIVAVEDVDWADEELKDHSHCLSNSKVNICYFL